MQTDINNTTTNNCIDNNSNNNSNNNSSINNNNSNSNISNSNNNISNSNNNKKVVDEELIYPFDINYSIKKIDLLLNSLIYNSKNENIKQCDSWIVRLPSYCSRLQAGYNCGLVALRMVIEYLDRSFLEKEYISDVFLTAVMKGYTKEGEMFSSFQLSEISNLIFNNINFNYIKSRVEQYPSAADILNQLSNGKPILVPYDADQNWRPCSNTGGKKAHWAMVIGFIVPNYYKYNNSGDSNSNSTNNKIKYKIKLNNNNSNNNNNNNNNYFEDNPYDSSCDMVLKDQTYNNKYLILNNTSNNSSTSNNSNNNLIIKFYQKPNNSFNRLSFIDDDYDQEEDEEDLDNNNNNNINGSGVDDNQQQNETKYLDLDEIFLICQHGKSQIIQLWELTALMESNNSLTKFPDERRDDSRWIIPNDLNDLKNKWIFFNK